MTKGSVQNAKRFRYAVLARRIFFDQESTRSELSEKLGWKLSTVTRLTTEMREAGIIEERGAVRSGTGAGRPTDILAIAPPHCRVLGIDFGIDQLQWSVADAAGNELISQVEEPLPFHPKPEAMEAMLDRVVASMRRQNLDPEQISALCLGIHAFVSGNGEWMITEENGLLTPFDVRDQLLRRFGCPLLVEDVARLFAAAEQRLGHDRDHPDVLYLFIGPNGLGSGIVANNELVATGHGISGEIGHVTAAVGQHARSCDCGKAGCLHVYATGHAIARDMASFAAASFATDAEAYVAYPLPSVCAAARAGEPLAEKVLFNVAGHMAVALGNAVNLLGTPRVVICGEFKNAGERFRVKLEADIRLNVVPALARHVSVGYAVVEHCAGARGGALRALGQYWEQPNL